MKEYQYVLGADDTDPYTRGKVALRVHADADGRADRAELSENVIVGLLRARWNVRIWFGSETVSYGISSEAFRLFVDRCTDRMHEHVPPPPLDNKTCYEQADKLGLIDKNIGFGTGQRRPMYLDHKEEPLLYECNRSESNTTTSLIIPGRGTILCPVPGAVAVGTP
jgi:hypothetical protein